MEIIPKNLSSKLTTRAKNAINGAVGISKTNRSEYVGSLHIAYGIIKEQGSLGASILKNFSVSALDLEERIKELPKAKEWRPVFSENMWKAIESAALYANNFSYKYLGTEHLLMGILSSDDSDFRELLKNKNIDPENVKRHIKVILENGAYFPDITKVLEKALFGEKITRKGDVEERSALDVFAIDLTEKAAESKLDIIIGRDKELEKLVNVLGRKNKNNPVLIGDPGVGKTAVVHKLAQRIIDNNVPANLIGKRIISLDLALLVAGTMFRGEFEARLKDVLEEAENSEDVILFIDEIHTIVGAGSASGSLDAANILKPALTRGEFQCVGATTLDEYRKYIEKDAALERRFQPIVVEEPTIEETSKIIRGIKHLYESYHNVGISEDAIEAAVELSSRYIQGRKLPDKAIDLIDEASAKIKSANNSAKGYIYDIKQLEQEKEELEYRKEASIKGGDYEKAIAERDRIKEVSILLGDLKKMQNNIDANSPKAFITRSDIARLISENTGIPLADLEKKEAANLKNMERTLKSRIAGQDEAISIISKAIRRSRAGLADPKRPIGSFIFMGPTGVGKTELARVIAEKIFNNSKALIKIDMSEFSEKHAISRLIGAPAGYVGYEEGGNLTERIKRNPHSVVLFDEVEKAHPDVLNILLQIMEDGILADSSGKAVSFKNALIILTSNIGTSDFTQEAKIGFSNKEENNKTAARKMAEKYEEIEKRTMAELKRQMLPEILSRLSGVVIFKPLGKKEIEKIIRMQLEELFERVKKEKGVEMKISKTALRILAEKAFSPGEGARNARKIIQKYIEDPAAEMIIDGKIKKGKICEITAEGKNIKIE